MTPEPADLFAESIENACRYILSSIIHEEPTSSEPREATSFIIFGLGTNAGISLPALESIADCQYELCGITFPRSI
ncbi:MAG: hypothetical protein DA328_06705 [Nitrososphaeraceae archaeon]|nr:hypothetical protein [Nitrososphaeraceae archaeon]